MLNIRSPRKNNSLLRVHSKRNSLISRNLRIARKERRLTQYVVRNTFHPPTALRIHHQIIPPRHRQQVTESAQRHEKRAILNRTRVNQIRLNFFDHTSKIEGQTRHIPPAEFAPPACPQNLLNIRRDRTILRLPSRRLELQKEDFMFRLCQRRQKPIIVRSVVLAEINDFQSFTFQVSGVKFQATIDYSRSNQQIVFTVFEINFITSRSKSQKIFR